MGSVVYCIVIRKQMTVNFFKNTAFILEKFVGHMFFFGTQSEQYSAQIMRQFLKSSSFKFHNWGHPKKAAEKAQKAAEKVLKVAFESQKAADAASKEAQTAADEAVEKAQKVADEAQQAADVAQKAADEAFTELGIGGGAAKIIKSRLRKTSQPEETFLKCFEKHCFD